MASSRKRPPKPDPADSALLSALERAVAQARPEPAGLLIAYSGGPDSTALLDLACRLRDAKAPGFEHLQAAHVHHGLQAEADAWAQHCVEQCTRRGITCAVLRVTVAKTRGTEDGARTARYGALLAAARDAGAGAVLTAHHADDRIETFLLQWLRGAGPAGLAGIAGQRGLKPAGVQVDPDVNDVPPVQVLRPLLAATRQDLDDYLQRHAIASVQDPSNADPRYARNALRLNVLPELARIRSGYARAAARSIELVGEAAEVLEELAQEGLQACTEGAPEGMLRLDALASLSFVRCALILHV